MADARVRAKSGPYALRVENGQLLSGQDTASVISNMVPTEEGTLRSIHGPCPYQVTYGQEFPVGTPYAYPGQMHGIGHGLIRGGERDVLLVHSGSRILVHQGFRRSWSTLLGSGGLIAAEMADDARPRAPTQFEFVPNGVVIVPQQASAYFYDGDEILPLGYSSAPAPPNPIGPRSSLTLENQIDTGPNYEKPGLNDNDYAFDAQYGSTTGMNPWFGVCRVGTVERFPGATVDPAASTPYGVAAATTSGQLLDGRVRAAVQWIDRWGNLSPLSGRSAAVHFDLQRSRTYDAFNTQWNSAKPDLALKQIAWSGIQPGPTGTIGRILCRTRDELHSGTDELFEVPDYAAEGLFGFATIPDNVCNVYPDNIPDAWLIRKPVSPVPVGKFRLVRLAFGRLWAGNFQGDPGRIHPSMPGRWGTFLEHEEMYPDSQGKGVTGMWRCDAGLLVCSESATYLIAPAVDSFNGFQSRTLSTTAGCVAPSSFATLPDGLTVWLGREGFYGFRSGGKEGPQLLPVSDNALAYLLRSRNHGRCVQACAIVDPRTKEYRCWLPVNGSRTNNLCLVFDGKGWRRRDDIEAAAVCVTNDHRGYVLAAGRSTDSVGTVADGVWVQDHQARHYVPAAHVSVVETAWMAAARSHERHSPLTISLWIRETRKGALTSIEAMRDWRETPVVQSHTTFTCYTEQAAPPFWGTAVLNDSTSDGTAKGTPNTYVRRRPLWKRVDLFLPSCESFRLRITGSRWDFVGFQVDETPQPQGGAQVPR